MEVKNGSFIRMQGMVCTWIKLELFQMTNYGIFGLLGEMTPKAFLI